MGRSIYFQPWESNSKIDPMDPRDGLELYIYIYFLCPDAQCMVYFLYGCLNQTLQLCRRHARSVIPFVRGIPVWQYPTKLTTDKGKNNHLKMYLLLYKNGDFRFVVFVLGVTGPTWNKATETRARCLGKGLHLLLFWVPDLIHVWCEKKHATNRWWNLNDF